MKISVVIPVYNAAAYLEGALRSVVTAAARTDAATEVVCVDDGSTDASGAMLDAFAAQNASGALAVRVIHQPNGGEGAARNAGVAVATGDLIAFLDADDAFHPQALAAFAAAALKARADVIRYGWKLVMVTDVPFEPFQVDDAIKAVDLRNRDDSLVKFCQLGSATVVSREIARRVKWTGLRQGADLVFVLACLGLASRVAYVDAPVLHYLTHPESASRRLTLSLLAGTCAYLPRVWSGCCEVGESPKARLATCRFVAGFALLRLPGSWRKLDSAEDRCEVRRAWRRMLGELAADECLFRPWVRRILSSASRRESSSVALPLVRGLYRALKRFPSLWFVEPPNEG